jgi:enoyl-CoA hydratase/carnithine racemase
MNYSQVLYEVAEGVCTITLNRPDRLNAFTGTMGDEIYAAFEAANAADDVRVIILTGAGNAFCAGVDLQALADPAQAERIVKTPLLSRFPVENYRNPKPTICAINGAAIGVGITMCLSFDLRIADEGAKISVPFVKLGLLPGLGSTYLLQRLMGRGRALDLLLSARSVTAAEAHQLGLIERLAAPGMALAVAREVAAALAKCDPLVVGDVKAMINFGADVSLEQAVENEGKHFVSLRARKAKGMDA